MIHHSKSSNAILVWDLQFDTFFHFQLVISHLFLIVTSINIQSDKYSKLFSYPVMGEQNEESTQDLHLINDSFTLITSCHYPVCFFYFVPFNICPETKNLTFEERKKNQSCSNCGLFDKCLMYTCLKNDENAWVIYELFNSIVCIQATVSITSAAVQKNFKTIHYFGFFV